MFNCVTCGKVFAYKRNLVRHVKTRDGKTNTCGICLKTYTRRYNLTNHVQNCHKMAPSTPEFQNTVRITGAMAVRDSVIRWAPPATPLPQADPVAPSPAPISNCRTDPSTPVQVASPYERVSVITINRGAGRGPTTADTTVAVFDRSGPSSSHCCAQCVNQGMRRNVDWPALVCSVQENSVPKRPEYSTLLSRLKTFGSHPLRSCQGRYSLAECGFAYTGTGDTVRCFYCGLSLSEWEEHDEVWLSHAVHNPKCVYVLLCKGVQFIENAKRITESYL